jgi:hypothetical protein
MDASEMEERFEGADEDDYHPFKDIGGVLRLD